MSIEQSINRINNNVQTTLNTIAETGVEVGTGSDALPAAASALANEKANVNHTHNEYAKTSDIPTTLSQLSADATHRTVTDTEKSAWNAKSNFSGSYNDLTNKPTIPSAYTHPSTHAASMISAGTFAGQVVANSSGQTAGTYLIRNIKLSTSAENPSTNGQICFKLK